MERSKIHFSLAETELMKNADIVLTKNAVLQKIKILLEDVQEMQTIYIKKSKNLINHDFFSIPPKISKGENYLGLPYLILDYPRISTVENFLFIRIMFWWGNFFSSTLQAGGTNKEKVQILAANEIEQLSSKNYFVSSNTDKWVHHFEKENYQKISSLGKTELNRIFKNSDHIKIAAKWPLSDWPGAAINLFESWKFLLVVSGLVAQPVK